tara:strand:- start:189 stop:335 length:147 start_codon:yes stop_codon:yes gene_type:complete
LVIENTRTIALLDTVKESMAEAISSEKTMQVTTHDFSVTGLRSFVVAG